MFPKSQLWLLGILLVTGGVSAFSGRIDPYIMDVALGAGIAIVLASSLNLINGFTGQFSLGHAGFMAVGAYASAMLSTTLGPKLGWSASTLQWTCLLYTSPHDRAGFLRDQRERRRADGFQRAGRHAG